MSRTSSQQALLARMREVVIARAEHVAVHEQNRKFNYAEFGVMIECLHQALERAELDAREPIGLLLDRSALAYAAMWAAISRGSPYVPLNTTYPYARLRSIKALFMTVWRSSTRSAENSCGIRQS